MKALLSVFLFRSLVALGSDDIYSDEAWLREGLVPQIAKYKRTTLIPHPEYHDILAANCETELSWWGSIRVFHQTAGKIDWIATFPKEYGDRYNHGHYVLSCEWRYLAKLEMWVLEVFDSTHMGNGSLWLFTLDGHDLRLLLHTTARGHYLKPPADLVVPALGETHLVEEHLNADYRTPTDAATDVEAVFLTGTITAFDGEGKESSTKPFKETWTWDADKRVFTLLPP